MELVEVLVAEDEGPGGVDEGGVEDELEHRLRALPDPPHISQSARGSRYILGSQSARFLTDNTLFPGPVLCLRVHSRER
eukprot:1076815-Rhodomonas_salina.1